MNFYFYGGGGKGGGGNCDILCQGGQNFVTLCDTGGGVEIPPKPRDILNGQPLVCGLIFKAA